MMTSAFRQKLGAALALDLPYVRHHSAKRGTPAAVLLLFAWRENGNGPELLITRRTDTVEKHKGQMAFPGGVLEGGESPEQGALRETKEEVGIDPAVVEVQGALSPLWTVTDFWVHPVVAILTAPIEQTPLTGNPGEIAEAFWVPLATLFLPETYAFEEASWNGVTYPIHSFTVGGNRIWGVTGAIIKNLLDRLSSLG